MWVPNTRSEGTNRLIGTHTHCAFGLKLRLQGSAYASSIRSHQTSSTDATDPTDSSTKREQHVELICVSDTLFDRDQKLFFTPCRSGEHTYRGHGDVLLTDTVRGREVRLQVESLNRLTVTCP